jgi:hypothetical protein
MTGDRYDKASWLDRDVSTYRVNLGVSRGTYEGRFGPAPRQAAGQAVIDTGFDYTATDTVMPHPFYAPLHWVCVVNPRERTAVEWPSCSSRRTASPSAPTTTSGIVADKAAGQRSRRAVRQPAAMSTKRE